MRSEIRGSIRVSARKAARVRDPKRYKSSAVTSLLFIIWNLQPQNVLLDPAGEKLSHSVARWQLVFEWLGVPFEPINSD